MDESRVFAAAGVPAPSDRQFEENEITQVDGDADKGWAIQLDHGWSFCVPAGSPVAPRVGMTARLYGRGIGSVVRGLLLDGRVVFYRTEAEEDERHRRWVDDQRRGRQAEFEANREDHDRRIAALPPPLRDRILKFQAADPDFRRDLEDYELFVCEQAALFAGTHRTLALLEHFRGLPFEEQLRLTPGMSDGHSGNTFAAACTLAAACLVDPRAIPRLPGALAPLVGSAAYEEPRSGQS